MTMMVLRASVAWSSFVYSSILSHRTTMVTIVSMFMITVVGDNIHAPRDDGVNVDGEDSDVRDHGKTTTMSTR